MEIGQWRWKKDIRELAQRNENNILEEFYQSLQQSAMIFVLEHPASAVSILSAAKMSA